MVIKDTKELQGLGKPVVFTDLDGTLLDGSYAFDTALPALHLIDRMNIPLVFCSSKTRSEIEFYRTLLKNEHPFISENGGGIFIPIGYFDPGTIVQEYASERDSKYDLIRLGAHYADLRKAFEILRAEGFAVKGFGDMSAEEIEEAMGLPAEQAKMAKQRDFDEPFFYGGKKEEVQLLFDSIREKGLSVTQGKIYHLLGQSDKGKAVNLLSGLYQRKWGSVTTIGIGDSPNDMPMLQVVDVPVIVQKPDGTYDRLLSTVNAIRAHGSGPVGWNSIITELLASLAVQT